MFKLYGLLRDTPDMQSQADGCGEAAAVPVSPPAAESLRGLLYIRVPGL